LNADQAAIAAAGMARHQACRQRRSKITDTTMIGSSRMEEYLISIAAAQAVPASA
jgi:hypothetical protein